MKTRRFLTVTVGVLVLSAGIFVGSRDGNAPAAPPPANPGQPFDQILTMLTQLQTTVSKLQTQVNGLPTTQVDLSGVTQNWDKVLPAAQRFVILAAFNNEAVRDNETGLVWEQSPVTTAHVWNSARFECTGRTTGGRKGWRLPSVHELASLMDPNNPSGNPNLPPGHPFSAVQSSDYWSATTVADGPGNAWLVNFSNNNVATNPTANTLFVLCVRGGMNADAY